MLQSKETAHHIDTADTSRYPCHDCRSNRNQVQAMADEVEERLYKAGYEQKQIEGYQTANWILMDYRDVVIHIFDQENRRFYDLARIWRDGKDVAVEEL